MSDATTPQHFPDVGGSPYLGGYGKNTAATALGEPPPRTFLRDGVWRVMPKASASSPNLLHFASLPPAKGAEGAGLRSFYSFANEEEVEDFLARKPHIIKILHDLSDFFKERYGVTENIVEHIEDDYYGYDTLDVTPKLHTKDREELRVIRREVLDSFFFPLGLSFSEGIAVSI